MTSKRQQIVTAIDTRLKLITITNGYETNAGNNVYEWRSSAMIESELPGLIYRDTQETEALSIGYQVHTLTIEIEGYVVGNAAPANLRKLIADVIKAIGVDSLWSALAEDTRSVEETIQVEQEERRIAGTRIKIEVDYRTGIFNPYT